MAGGAWQVIGQVIGKVVGEAKRGNGSGMQVWRIKAKKRETGLPAPLSCCYPGLVAQGVDLVQHAFRPCGRQFRSGILRLHMRAEGRQIGLIDL